MAIDFIENFYVKKFNPCKMCLVKVTCEISQKSKCKSYSSYCKTIRFIDTIDSWIENAFIGGVIFGGLLFIITTFLLGIWQWIQIFDFVWHWFYDCGHWIISLFS